MNPRPLFVTIGDSITERGYKPNGWCQRLMQKYGIKADFLNRGFSGYNTEILLPLMEDLTKDIQHASVITLMMGSNDASEGFQNVSLDNYFSNLTKMVQILKKNCSNAEIILISSPPVDESRELQRKVDTLQKYSEMAEKVSKEEKVYFLNLWETMQMQMKWEDFLEDGLHMEESGDEFIFLEMNTFISINLPKLHPNDLEYPFKHWSEIFKK
jgi:isoamyl acetate esterase